MLMTDKLVTHPAGGVYLSKFMAGILTTVLTAAMIGAFGNLWYLNRKSIEFQDHVNTMRDSQVITRNEYEAEKRVWRSELKGINDKLDALQKAMDEHR